MAVPYYLQQTSLFGGGAFYVTFTEENSTTLRWTAGDGTTGTQAKANGVILYNIAAQILDIGGSPNIYEDEWTFHFTTDAVAPLGVTVDGFENVTIINESVIAGKGGAGGSYGSSGSAGSDAIRIGGYGINYCNCVVDNRLGGYIIGGGGGGRSGLFDTSWPNTTRYGRLAGTAGGGGGWNGGNGGSAQISNYKTYTNSGNKYINSFGVGGTFASGGTGNIFYNRTTTVTGGLPTNSAARYSWHSSDVSFGPGGNGRVRNAGGASEGGGNGGPFALGYTTTSGTINRDYGINFMPGSGGGATPIAVASAPSAHLRGFGATVYIWANTGTGGVEQGTGATGTMIGYWGAHTGYVSGGGGGRGAAGGAGGAGGYSVRVNTGGSVTYVDEPGNTGTYWGSRDT